MSGGPEQFSILLANIPDADLFMPLATAVESNGFRRVWIAETNGLEAASIGAVLAATTSLEVGTSIVPVYTRTPALLAMMAATWSRLAGGRTMHIGIGAGGRAIIERWHGAAFTRPVRAVSDTISIMRMALDGRRTQYEGQVFHSDGFRLEGDRPANVRIYVGGMGPLMQRLAAAEADGLIATWISPRVAAGFRGALDEASRASGGAGDRRLLATRAYVAVVDDIEAVRSAVRSELTEYILSPPYAEYFLSIGFESEVQDVRAAFALGDRVKSARAVSDRMLDEMLIVGRDADEIAEPLRSFISAGADDVIVQPVAESRGGNPMRTIEAVAQVRDR